MSLNTKIHNTEELTVHFHTIAVSVVDSCSLLSLVIFFRDKEG